MTLSIGLIGTGSFAAKHGDILAAMEDVKVTGVVGSSREKADTLASRYPGASGYGAVADMIEGAKLDAAYICVPPFAHGGAELALAEAGIPFFVEKPLGVDLATPSRILEQVTAQSLITSVGYHFRYMDSAARAKELLAGQTAGMAIGRWLGGMPGVYWWRKQEGSGGQLVEQTTHIIDLLRYLMGEVTEVYAAYAQRVMHEEMEGVTVPDVGALTLKMASGAVASITNTCMSPHAGSAGLQIYASGGLLELEHQQLIHTTADQKVHYKNKQDPYQLENQIFIEAVRTGDPSAIRSTYADAWRTQQVTEAAGRSAQIEQPVRII
ncbi:Gfo/Idh/MocA family protein [Paenibacillus sp. 1P07SE]|uniref:Gfo/Idh/MocA family protein n=1 Tax=Paenibacillus sp. 1P07SE TaxID=3132209 RepID=UPI0039A6AABB